MGQEATNRAWGWATRLEEMVYLFILHLGFSYFFFSIPTLCISTVTKGRKTICDLGEQEGEG